MKNPRFITRVFGSSEQVLLTGARRFQRAAAHFAAKEAFAKAMGSGVRGFSLCEVEVLRDELGAPFLSLSGAAAELAKQRGFCFSVSLTHEKGYAAAVVLARPASCQKSKLSISPKADDRTGRGGPNNADTDD